MARPSNTRERRSEIVQGMLVAMAEHGYDGASVQRIAEAAELAPGLVHYHFESKQDILLALVEHLSLALRERFERRAREAHSATARLHAFIDAHLALGPDASPRAVACWVAIGAEAVRQPEVQRAYRAALRTDLTLLEELVRAVLAERCRSQQAAPQIAAALLSAILGSYQLSLAAQAAPRGFAAPAVRDMADGLIAAQPEK